MPDLTLPTWIVTRQQWGAKPPTRPRVAQKLPTPRLWLHHSVTATGGAEMMRRIQKDHQSRGWRDIAYTFAVGIDAVYEGIGVEYRHLNSDGPGSGTILLVGNFDIHHLPDGMIRRTAHLVAHGVLAGWWSDELSDQPHLTGGHRDLAATACPGRFAHARIGDINTIARQQILDLQEDDMAGEITQAVGHDQFGQWYRFNGDRARRITPESAGMQRFFGIAEVAPPIVDLSLDLIHGWVKVEA